LELDGVGLKVVAAGDWILPHAAQLETAIDGLKLRRGAPVAFDLSLIGRLDTAGAWLIHRSVRDLIARGLKVTIRNLDQRHQALYDTVIATEEAPPPVPVPEPLWREILTRVGASMEEAWEKTVEVTAFLGLVLETLARTLMNPRRLRYTSLVFHLEETGFNAVPIISLISFLIGVVLAYQGADQLRQFGAEVFTVNLISLSVLREIGILLTAIVVAGRSGSAFTAQIGSMKVREEVDAIRTLGLDPIEILVLPRLLALLIALPCLAFVAAVMGLLGGAVMCWSVLGITPEAFLSRLQEVVKVNSFLVGMIKAPFFAVVISVIGCFEGFKVTGSAESVGQLTTRSVVESIFLVIILDAAFSIFFSAVGI